MNDTIRIIFHTEGHEWGPIEVRCGDKAIRSLCRDEALYVVAHCLVSGGTLYNSGFQTDGEWRAAKNASERRRAAMRAERERTEAAR